MFDALLKFEAAGTGEINRRSLPFWDPTQVVGRILMLYDISQFKRSLELQKAIPKPEVHDYAILACI